MQLSKYPTELRQILATFNSIHPLKETEVKDIVDTLSIHTLNKNDFLLEENHICDRIAFLNSGMIRHYYPTRNDEVTRWMSLQGDFSTSLRSFILQIPSVEYLQAITDCEIVTFNLEGFEHLIKKNEGFKNIWTKTIELTYIAIEERVFSLIEKSAEERFNWMVKFQPRFIQQVPVMYVASMLGITPRHLSRLKRQIKEFR